MLKARVALDRTELASGQAPHPAQFRLAQVRWRAHSCVPRRHSFPRRRSRANTAELQDAKRYDTNGLSEPL